MNAEKARHNQQKKIFVWRRWGENSSTRNASAISPKNKQQFMTIFLGFDFFMTWRFDFFLCLSF
ncbi:hypothetical protein NG798_09700 [Ancylothrix sp. C2]|uniref:hypothetical protein n=1 Tax=Ancylothrix sp. D3o TaxID=2953691 RepID=UPI0021BB5195|nr:hypothetical protein [Ancylothrix sp. D3o]MCT7950058.1 hypothetical protein [Ancylothrix sp. D3o]